MAEVQSGPGKIRLFTDCSGAGVDLASTIAPLVNHGDFHICGQGIAEDDSGAPVLTSDGLNGVIQLTTTDEDIHCIGFQTGTMFDVGKMAPIVLEARVRPAEITTGEVFIGFSDVCTDLAIIEGALFHGNTVTITNTASDGCGFLQSSELTDASDWHAVYNGGTATAVTVSTSLDLDDPQVVGDWQILRLEIDPNGTVRWYIDGVLKKTVEGAVSTSTDLCAHLLVESKTTAVKTLDVDYFLVEANRDWTV